MSVFVVWVDRETAKVFQFSNEKMERTVLHAQNSEHHTHALESVDHQRQERSFFKDVVGRLAEAARILILGPGVAKHHFQTYLMEQFPAVAKRVVGCETVDHPTDPQIAALAKRFFGAKLS